MASLPATYDSDTVWQILSWANSADLNNQHPFLSTALFGSLAEFAADNMGTVAIVFTVYALVQYALMSLATAALMCYVKRFSIPTWFFRLIFVLVCGLVAYPSYATEIVKDSLFVLPMIGFIIMFVEAVRTRGACLNTPGRVVLFAFFIISASLMRKTGVYIIVPSLVVLAIYAQRGCRARWWGMAAFCLVAIFSWNHFALSAMGVEPSPTKETLSLPLQQTAAIVVRDGEDLSDQERAVIEKVLPVDVLADVYDTTSTDHVKDRYLGKTTDDLVEYLGVWASTSLRHPDIAMTATLCTNEWLFAPLLSWRVEHNLNREWVTDNAIFFTFALGDVATQPVEVSEAAQRYVDDGVCPQAARLVAGMEQFECLQPVRTLVYGYEKVLSLTPLRIIGSESFLTFYLPFLLLCSVLVLRGRRHMRFGIAIALIPSILLVLSIVAGPLVVTRYCAPAAYFMPIVATLPYIMSRKNSRDARDESCAPL